MLLEGMSACVANAQDVLYTSVEIDILTVQGILSGFSDFLDAVV